MSSTLSPHQWIRCLEDMGGPFHALVIAGLNESGLDQTLAPDLYAAAQAFRTGVTPLYQALESLIVKYSLQCSPDEYWDENCE